VPYAAPHVCPAPGCSRIAPRGKRCEQHAARQAAERRAHDAFYYSPAWRALRAAHLMANPRCTHCGGPGHVVDHVVPRRQAPGRALDPSNLSTCCASCHSTKTARTDGGWGEGGRS
jgi:5-methylcytosine-specific restriction protein A